MLSSLVGHRSLLQFGLNKKILVIEDKSQFRGYLDTFFNNNGDTVDFATSARDGIDKAREVDYDLILLDFAFDDFPEDPILPNGEFLAKALVQENVNPKKIAPISNRGAFNQRIVKAIGNVAFIFSSKHGLGSPDYLGYSQFQAKINDYFNRQENN